MQSDDRLVKLFRRGVEPAFDELVNRYRVALVAYAGSIAGRDRAEDVVQESLVKAHRSLARDQAMELKPWLYRVVRNTALNDIRDNRKHGHEGLGETPNPSFEQPHDVAERREELATVVAAVSALPTSQRRALVGHELGGFSYDEIAAELDVTPGATRQLIYRARLSLRNSFGALIPFPLIAWLASGTTSMFASGAAGGAATGAAATGTLGTSADAGAGAAGGGIAGGGGTKLAVVAIVAGGSLVGGVAVERQQHDSSSNDSNPAVLTQASGDVPGSSSGNSQAPASLATGITGGSSGSGSSGSDEDSKGENGSSGGDRDSSGFRDDSGGERSGSDDDSSGSGGGGHSGPGGGDDGFRPAREDSSGPGPGGDDDREQLEGDRPDSSGPGSDDDGSGGSGISGEGSSGSGSSGSGSDPDGSGSSDSGSYGDGGEFHSDGDPLPDSGSGDD